MRSWRQRCSRFQKTNRIDYRFIYKMRSTLLDEDVDIVSAHHFSPLFWGFFATRWSKMKLVYTEHSRWQLEQLELINKILNRLFFLKTDAIVAISKQIEDYYLKYMSIDKKKNSSHQKWNRLEII